MGIANGETAYANKALFDATNPAALGTAGPGTSLVAAHRDHVHTLPKLDDVAAPDNNTDLDASTTVHGLLLKATAPAANVLNVVGIANGETAYANKALFDATNPAALGTAAPGTSLIAAHRDHVHTLPVPDVSPICCPFYYGVLNYTSVGQGTWHTVTLGCLENYTTHADGDNASVAVRLPAGTYTLRVQYFTGPDFGKFDTYIDASNLGNTDAYAAGGISSAVEFTGQVIAAGAHTVKFQLNGKNGSSSTYKFGTEAFSFIRTA